jgi:N-acetylneuraminate synthase
MPLKRSIRKGDVFYDSDLEIAESQTSTEFAFEGNWGIPVRHHDYENFLKIAQPKILEFHLSYADLRLSHSDFLNCEVNCDLVVHSPELFYGDHVLDLTSDNDEYRAKSIENMRDTIHVVEELSVKFQNYGTKISLVTNVGGFSMDAPLDDEQIKLKTEILLDSLSKLASDFIEILPQTMPPFPWHFGGQRYHNLFLDADWIDRFCTMTGTKICLDTSHSALRCNQTGYLFSDFLDKVLPHTQHIHFADAKGVHDEGLQIGSGDIDWNMVCAKVNELAPVATWIPEIWQGHEDQGKKFWLALEHLKKAGIR